MCASASSERAASAAGRRGAKTQSAKARRRTAGPERRACPASASRCSAASAALRPGLFLLPEARHVLPVLVEHEPLHLSVGASLEREPRVNDLVEELRVRLREDRELLLARRLHHQPAA